MRVEPIGLFSSPTPHRAFTDEAEAAAITHGHRSVQLPALCSKYIEKSVRGSRYFSAVLSLLYHIN